MVQRVAARPARPTHINRGRLALASAAQSVAAVDKKPQKRPHDDGEGIVHVGIFVLGLAVVAAGVAIGIGLGGWLGLGVAAAIVLLGYVVATFGIGGRHAWLEIYQEFFNL
ncbi:hypothetical protein LJY25_20590 [Hymenobacter sp. BT175]|uniref:hypothetical protein n=1 Tax=Hymenobacter translucens TaxID=2886507 RepID=UPI001D0E3E07|nr:hypothetical protein [Hymenobacter translucens]MCC2548859.1 hypothetical protein [Hymenobacter translucens]